MSNFLQRIATLCCIGFGLAACATSPADTKTVSRYIVERPSDKPGQEATRIEVLAQGQGPLIVMLPSLGRDAEDFDVVAAEVAAAGFRILRPEPRGIGASRGAMKNVTLHDFADDIAAVIQNAGGGPAIVAGHAYGNFVARTLAGDHPALVRAVILLAPAGRRIPPDLIDAILKSSDITLPTAQRLDYLKKAFFAPGHDPAVWLDGWFPEVVVMQRDANAATKENWRSAGNVPLLVISARQDALLGPSGNDGIQDELGKERVSMAYIDQAGHALVPEQPAAVAKAIVDYARGLKN